MKNLFRKLKNHSIKHKKCLDKIFKKRVQHLRVQNLQKNDLLEKKLTLFLKNQAELALVVYKPNPRFWI